MYCGGVLCYLTIKNWFSYFAVTDFHCILYSLKKEKKRKGWPSHHDLRKTGHISKFSLAEEGK